MRSLRTSGFPDGSDGKGSACNEGDLGSIPGLGRLPRERHGNPLQYSCLENPMDRGAWWATVRGVAKKHHGGCRGDEMKPLHVMGSGHLLDADTRLTLVQGGTPATAGKQRASSTEGEVTIYCCPCWKSALCWKSGAAGDTVSGGVSLGRWVIFTTSCPADKSHWRAGPRSIFQAHILSSMC